MEKEQVQRIVQEVLEHPKLNSENEAIVTRYVKRTILQIQAHCNRNDLPEALEAVASQIVEDMLTADGIINENKGVSSVHRGDTTIAYHDPSSAYQGAVNFMKDYECQLVHFKRMKLPSDPRDERS